MICGRSIEPGERIYRHVDSVLCAECHDKQAAALVPYPTAIAVTRTACGENADAYNVRAEAHFALTNTESDPCQNAGG